MAPTFVTTIDLSLADKLKNDLTTQGFTLSTPIYTVFQAKKKGISCTLYQSGKLLVQGKDKHEFITYYLEPEILKNLTYSYPESLVDKTPRIGVDEAGKGDFFGPLCIGAVYADESGIENLVKIGVRDSKQMTDRTIKTLAEKIKKNYAYAVIQIFPKRYNELYEKFNNLNHLLAWGHAAAIEEVCKKTNCVTVTIDQFANESLVKNAVKRKNLELKLTQQHRGEEDVIVAAASILARAAFVDGIQKLSDEYHQKLPKGAANHVIDAGKALVAKHGKEILRNVAKLHFKTVDAVLRG